MFPHRFLGNLEKILIYRSQVAEKQRELKNLEVKLSFIELFLHATELDTCIGDSLIGMLPGS